MKKFNFLSTALIAVALFVGHNSMAQEKTVMVGGAEMYPSKNIIENIVNSEDHTTLVAAVKAAGLVETLSSEGPFTVFAPVNDAFDALPEGTVETLLKPENKKTLAAVLTYHVVAGTVNAADVLKLIEDNDGAAVVKTIMGSELTFTTEGGNVYITDTSGNKAMVTIANVKQSNGVIHVINKVLLPKA
jgi:uncharacterized surface protein with fasciclin (FAS1) repeats